MSHRQTSSFFENEISPIAQVGATLVGILFFSLVLWILRLTGLAEMATYHFWTISASMTLLYAVGNSVLSLASSDENKYWGQSIFGFAVVAVVGGLIAYLFSGLGIFDAKSYSWIYFVFTFVYLLFLSIVRIMRKIVELVEKQDRRLRGEE
jgi:hypothetical protein